MIGKRYASDFPDAVPVEMITCSPERARSAASAWCRHGAWIPRVARTDTSGAGTHSGHTGVRSRSEEHTSELQSLRQLVCRLLLEKKNGDEKKKRNIRCTPEH